MQVHQIDIDSLIPYARNARTHSENQISQVAASIKEFGWVNPIIIDKDNGIIAGHGRVLAARKLGLDHVPCVRIEHLTETQKRAYILADNKLAANAGWDHELLSLEIGDLVAVEFDMDIVGFSTAELKCMIDLEQEDKSNAEYEQRFEVTAECADESEQKLIYDLLTSKGFKCRVLSM